MELLKTKEWINPMPSLTIKNLPRPIYDRLKQRASEHKRSLNSEIIVTLEKALFSRRIHPGEFLTRLDALQGSVSPPLLTDEILKKARGKGRS
jgi:plasmid stability protein